MPRALAKAAVRLPIPFALLLAGPFANAQVPGEVANVRVSPTSTISWNATSGASDYNVYRGLLSTLSSTPARCHGNEIIGTSFSSPANPAAGDGYFYLVTAESASGEGTPGNTSAGAARPLLGACDKVVRNHVLDRIGYGWNEWSRDRYNALGPQAYINEQLDPSSIDESTNQKYKDRYQPIHPPVNIANLVGLKVVNGTYARRQLEKVMGEFWENHFNTDWVKTAVILDSFYPQCVSIFPPSPPYCDTAYPTKRDQRSADAENDEYEAFMDLAFNGNFRQIVEESALSTEMIYYLDTYLNVRGVPNENFARELLELHTMGVDGGYVQKDVEQLARVFTGWDVCYKSLANQNDPLAACDPLWWIHTGNWVPNYRLANHDCGAKVLFDGTPQETLIPNTCQGISNPADPTDNGMPTAAGSDDVQIALDAIVAHPATARFIVKKLLRRFITDTPPQAMIDAVVTEWNDATNPNGVGDLREVLRAVLTRPEMLDPNFIRGKVKTPLELIISDFRAARGETDGMTSVYDYLGRMRDQPNLNPVPTGYSELGNDWIDTNGLLERQNFGIDFVRRTASTDPNFSADVIGLLNANGVSTAPGSAPAIVDFFKDVLFAGGLTPAQRQQAIDYLNTDDNGVSSSYNDARIRETVGVMMGFLQFMEQ